jgi:hypothetical protein
VERGIDILPVRFGTFVPDAEALARAIDEQAPALTRALKTVKGCVQMTVRLTLVDPGPARSKRPAGRRRAESGSIGTAYLRARAAARDSTGHGQVDRAVRAIARAVAPHVRAMRTESSERQATLFHLVHRRRIALHRQALAGAAGRTGAFVTVSGPLPPFAFADAGPGR